MSSPYIGEIRMFAGNFAPTGWSFCNGVLLAIAQNDALFALIGTTYGGDGQSTFALPDLRGRFPIHRGALAGGSTYTLGQSGGVETVTLTVDQMPAHAHIPMANANAGTASGPQGNVWAASDNYDQFAPAPGAVLMNAGVIAAAGGSQPHDNMPPFLGINFIIALSGIFPPR